MKKSTIKRIVKLPVTITATALFAAGCLYVFVYQKITGKEL